MFFFKSLITPKQSSKQTRADHKPSNIEISFQYYSVAQKITLIINMLYLFQKNGGNSIKNSLISSSVTDGWITSIFTTPSSES